MKSRQLGCQPSISRAPQRSTLTRALSDTCEYWKTLWYYWVRGGTFADCPYFKTAEGADDGVAPLRRQARVHVFSLALIMKLWSRPHYRHGS